MSILVVDDSSEQRVLLKRLLRKGKFTDLVFAESAKEAYNYLKLDNPIHNSDVDLILMDIMMPEIDGIKACRKIKEAEHLRDIPIIIVTGMTDNIASAFEAGAMDYIVKPVKHVELIARVRSSLKLKYEMDSRKARERDLMEVTRRLEDTNRKLHRLSLIDGLTGIANRRYFDEYLDHEWKRAIRETMHISLILIDIDYFKLFNDTYGHQAGDLCLKQVAQSLEDVLKRPADFVARYGGEEFSAILPNTELKGAVEVANNMLESVKGLKICHEKSNICEWVSISAGVACMVPELKMKPSIIIAEADRALYHAKQQGRSQVRWIDKS
ncbi:two-component system, chemotaxis family, response regulator WspR [Candidatus Magnetomoraceae bacterium gMMP-13]